MKKVVLIPVLLVLFISGISCNGQVKSTETEKMVSSSKVTVYYFHFTSRCATCLAVEQNALKAMGSLFPNEIKAGDYKFTSLNLDEASTKALADKLGVGGQALLVVSGDKKLDITSSAWLAARDLEKMKKELKSGIEKVIF
ncbi:MAG: nitrophenyl compound nitroreductase subunit ArsF family protein [Bacteroidales bacterium]